MQSGFLKLQSAIGETKKSWASMTVMSSGRSQVWPSVYFLYIKWNRFLVAIVEKLCLGLVNSKSSTTCSKLPQKNVMLDR